MKKLAKKVGLEYNEVKDILSSQTLKQFETAKIIGGATQEFCTSETDCLCSKQDNLCSPPPVR